MLRKLKKEFRKIYDISDFDIRKFFSPSRINIIGEHTDYNGGYVLPCALDLGTYGIARKNDENIVRIKSLNFESSINFSIDKLDFNDEHAWANYIVGMIRYIKEAGYEVGGMDILVFGDIPTGAGLSSSASLELLIGEMFNAIYNNGSIEKIELAKMGKKTENYFIGVNTGIMDQLIIATGKKEHASLIDTLTLESYTAPLNFEEHTLIIMNTNHKRELRDSLNNIRRQECQKALKELQSLGVKIDYLCQLPYESLHIIDLIEDPILRKRADHVIRENDRVCKAKLCLENNQIDELGALLRASNESLKDLFDVTGKHLDSITLHANNYPCCLGARMTGAGFGGCAIAIVHNEHIDDFMEYVSKKYKNDTGSDAEFIICNTSDGVHEVITDKKTI